MIYTCEKCKSTRNDQIIEQRKNTVRCPECSYEREYIMPSLFVIGGASGTGKTTICKAVAGKLHGVVALYGIIYPDVTVLPKLAEFFDVTADYLLGITKKTKSPRLIKTIEVFELESYEDAKALASEFSSAVFPRLVSYKTEEKSGKIILTAEKEFGVEFGEMKFNK